MDDTNEPTDSTEPTGRMKGGLARAAALSDERKREIAQRGALARWGARATHKGNFKEEFGIDVDCYVLDDPNKTAVISSRGMATALGLSESGTSLRRFVGGKVISQAVGADLLKKINKPLIFEGMPAGAGQPPMPDVHGHDVTLLIDVCKAIVNAESEGKLLKSQANIAKQAHIILNASAKSGIKGLVYALSGYDAARQEIIDAFKFYVSEEAREYEKEFPDQLYAEWYRLYGLPRPERNKPWKFKHLTVEHVYQPLARSKGKILELTQETRTAAAGGRWKRLHQFLSEVGVKALRTQLGQVLGIAQVSDTKEQYEANIRRVFGAGDEAANRQIEMFR